MLKEQSKISLDEMSDYFLTPNILISPIRTRPHHAIIEPIARGAFEIISFEHISLNPTFVKIVPTTATKIPEVVSENFIYQYKLITHTDLYNIS